MKVTVLGNNGPFPSAGGACSSYLIESGNTKILADAGSGSLSNLMKIMDPADLDCILLSHLHWDHITDVSVLFYYLHVSRLNGRDIKPISLYMPKTPAGNYEMIKGFNMFRTHILKDGQTIFIKDMEVETAAMTHPVETYALGFSAGSKSIVYSGDTTYNKRLPVFAEGCDILITDSAFLEIQLKESSPHMSASQSARVASEAGVKKLLLSHQVPGIDKNVYTMEAKLIFKNVEASRLMQTYEV